MTDERLASYHEFTRRHGVNRGLYLLARVVLQPFFLIYFALSRQGRKNSRIKGGIIVAANHRSFLDPFVIGACLPWSRPMNYVAKVELFEKPWQAYFLNRLGAFPIRRGEADEDAIETAEHVLERGGAICIFPEGTRIRKGSLGTPKRGVGRLAMRSGAAVLPVAVSGTENVRRGWRIRPRKVRLRVGRPMNFPYAENPSPALAASVTSRIWPNIELQWEDIGGLPPMRRAAVIGAGSWGTAVAVLLARGGLEVQLGTRTAAQAEAMSADRENAQLPAGREAARRDRGPGVERDRTGRRGPALHRRTVCFLPAGGRCGRRPGRQAGRCAAPGQGAHRAEGPASVRVRRRAGQGQGHLVPRRPGPRPRGRIRFGSAGARLRRRRSAGPAGRRIRPGRTDLRALAGHGGVEMAGAAKNAAVLAAAAAEPHGLNAAGIAATAVWKECVDFAVVKGADLDTFNGLAGVGDLLATVMAPDSRNRRAGELLGKGSDAEQIKRTLGQASEALDSVPQIAATLAESGCRSEATQGLADLATGRISSDEWVAALRRVGHSRRAA